MAEDFEKLAADWEDHPVVLVGEVDCTSDDGKPLCEEFDVQVCKRRSKGERLWCLYAFPPAVLVSI